MLASLRGVPEPPAAAGAWLWIQDALQAIWDFVWHGKVEFGAPWFLLLLLLIPLSLWMSLRVRSALSRPRRIATLGLRSLVLLLLILALAEMRLLLRNDRLAVFFLVDRSESIPALQREQARTYVDEALRSQNRQVENRAGVIAFGKLAGIESVPRTDDALLDSFVTLIEPDGTDIASAVRLAAAAFPEGYGKRIVILSDGNENRASVLEEIRLARSLGITVDTVPITYSHPAEMSVQKVLVDPEIRKGQPFDIRVVVESTVEAEANLRLFENGVPVPQESPRVKLQPGKNPIDFRGRRLEQAGRYYYEARLEPLSAENDGVFQNNVGFGFTLIRGEPKVLLCAAEPEMDQPLVNALRAEGITIETLKPAFLPQDVESYLEYEAVILSNVAAHELSEDLMTLFDGLVKTIGVGFIMIGGENSFGAGGYQGTPVERLLPVTMEIQQKRVLPNGALAMVVHSCELNNGNYWARQVIQQAIRILSPRDYAGVLYYGMGGEQWLFPMTRVSQRRRMLSLLGSFNPGDMPSFQNIMQMALTGLQSTPASIKHMIVLSDGDPTLPTQQVINSIRQARITISTICYGSHGPSLPPRMQQLASQGGGKSYFLTSPRNLPELFIREAAKVQRALISEEAFSPILAARGSLLEGIRGGDLPVLEGYVLTTPKSLATMHLLHPPGEEDPTQDPVLAAWSYGLGKSVAFTSDAGRRWGKQWSRWEGYQRFWGQCVQWVSRVVSDDTFRMSRSLDGDRARVVLDALTPDGRLLNGIRFQGQVLGPDHETHPVAVQQTAPGRYVAEFPAGSRGTYTMVFGYEEGGRMQTAIAGVSVPYSPEYRQLEADLEKLRQMAEAGGGRFHEDPDTALEEGRFYSRDFPTSYDVQGVWHALLVVGLALFYLDVFIRRVIVNYWASVLKAIGALKALVLRRKAVPEVVVDSRLSSLLERKSRLREASTSRSATDASWRPPEPRADRPGRETPAESGRPEPPPLPGKGAAATAEGAGRKAAEAEEAEESKETKETEGSFTARLLEVKKRALKRERDGK